MQRGPAEAILVHGDVPPCNMFVSRLVAEVVLIAYRRGTIVRLSPLRNRKSIAAAQSHVYRRGAVAGVSLCRVYVWDDMTTHPPDALRVSRSRRASLPISEDAMS